MTWFYSHDLPDSTPFEDLEWRECSSEEEDIVCTTMANYEDLVVEFKALKRGSVIKVPRETYLDAVQFARRKYNLEHFKNDDGLRVTIKRKGEYLASEEHRKKLCFCSSVSETSVNPELNNTSPGSKIQ